MNKYFFTSILILCILQLMSCGKDTNQHPIQIKLKSFINSQLTDQSLIIEYSDLHELWGGLKIVINGHGQVHQETVRREVNPPRDLTIDEVIEIVNLLVELQMWQQETPYRDPKPDESKARLKIAIGDEQSMIWEWFNDMENNNRLNQVLILIKKLVWE